MSAPATSRRAVLAAGGALPIAAGAHTTGRPSPDAGREGARMRRISRAARLARVTE
ncbi:MAG: hypothetical protein NTW56_02215 [Alphaproteobacteria bacterium]|nr:hypothetical protein [Alphaproteobacteria bacterium]